MKVLITALVLAFLAGCALNRPAVQRQSFLLQPVRGETMAPQAAAPSLKLGRVEVAAPFAGRGFVYRREAQRYETDFYNEFAADPADLVAAATSDWLRRSGRYRIVLDGRVPEAGDIRLDATVSALYVDFRSSPPAAVLAVRWSLVSGPGGATEVTAEERVPLATRSPAGAAAAYQEALRRVLERLDAGLDAGSR